MARRPSMAGRCFPIWPRLTRNGRWICHTFHMLPPPYEWRITPTSAHLDYRYGCVAFVLPDRLLGKYRSVIEWRGRVLEARCGSVAQGVRWIDRWIAAQGDRMPTNVRRWDVGYRERRSAL
jgi:hypothetical protein